MPYDIESALVSVVLMLCAHWVVPGRVAQSVARLTACDIRDTGLDTWSSHIFSLKFIIKSFLRSFSPSLEEIISQTDLKFNFFSSF